MDTLEAVAVARKASQRVVIKVKVSKSFILAQNPVLRLAPKSQVRIMGYLDQQEVPTKPLKSQPYSI